MGLFGIFKKRDVESEPESEPDVEQQPGQSETTANKEIATAPKTQSAYQRICFALRRDLDSFNGGDGWEQQTYIDGSPMLVKGISLSPMALGMFDLVVVAKLQDGTIHYDFLSKKYAPNEDLINFITKCFVMFGRDKNGLDVCLPADTESLKSGHFRRNWDNVNILQSKRADCPYITIAMRITITPQSK